MFAPPQESTTPAAAWRENPRSRTSKIALKSYADKGIRFWVSGSGARLNAKGKAMEYWLRCTVYPGQFSVEFAVVVRQSDGSQVSLFVPHEFVDCAGIPASNSPVPGRLRVALIDKRENLALVHLPRPTLENGQDITVEANQLEVSPQQQFA